MNDNLYFEIKCYLKEIAVLIPKDYPNKKQILQSIKQNLESFLEEFPESSFQDITNEFGTAMEIANSFIEDLSGTSVFVSLHKKKRRNHFILISCMILFMLSAFLCVSMYYFLRNHQNVSKGDTFYIYNGTEITHEEFLRLNGNQEVE